MSLQEQSFKVAIQTLDLDIFTVELGGGPTGEIRDLSEVLKLPTTFTEETLSF